MTFDLGLAGHRALVTAGTKGVGAAVIEVLRQNGARSPQSPIGRHARRLVLEESPNLDRSVGGVNTTTRCASVNLDVCRGFEPDVSHSYHNRPSRLLSDDRVEGDAIKRSACR